jgi:hypothetical protein
VRTEDRQGKGLRLEKYKKTKTKKKQAKQKSRRTNTYNKNGKQSHICCKCPQSQALWWPWCPPPHPRQPPGVTVLHVHPQEKLRFFPSVEHVYLLSFPEAY